MLIALKSHLYNIGSKAAFNLREPERAEAAKRPSLRVSKIGASTHENKSQNAKSKNDTFSLLNANGLFLNYLQVLDNGILWGMNFSKIFPIFDTKKTKKWTFYYITAVRRSRVP